MRNVFLLALLVYLLAFAYQKWVLEPDRSVAATSLLQEVPELSVVAQSSQQRPVAALATAPQQEVAVVAEPAALEYRCLRIGPFPSEADVGLVNAALQGREATVQQSAEESQVWVGYWVQSAEQSSRAAAEQLKAALAQGGLADAYILSENGKYRISLGIFRLRASADGVVRKAQTLGVGTRVIERYQPGTNYWLKIRIPEEQALQPSDLPSVAGQILRMERLSCVTAGI